MCSQRIMHRMAGNSQHAFKRNVHFDEQVEGGGKRHGSDENATTTAALQGAL